MRDFRNLDAWGKAHNFTLNIYRVTESFPKTETFGLSATLRRRSSDLAMKIAEGCGQDSEPDFRKCPQSATAIGVEVEYQLLLAHDLQFMESSVHKSLQDQVVEVWRMLSGLLKAVPV